MIHNADILLINKLLKGMTVREDKVIFRSKDGTFTIPSKIFPLTNKKTIKIFHTFNTELLENENVKEVFNEINFKMGRCYSNSRTLLFSSYCGWVFIGNSMPIHHSWVVYKDTYVIDGGITNILNCEEEMNGFSLEETRRYLLEKTKENELKPNSEIATFGKAYPICIYVGSICTPEDGRETFKFLTEKYPEHISYNTKGLNQHGMSKFQEMYYNKQ